jgi:excinuclease ABC subunit B
MYAGDLARKAVLVAYGFRLPSARENRPLNFEEFESLQNQMIYVSATPAKYELNFSQQVAEQIIRPTGLVDPEVKLHPVQGQVDHLLGEINRKVDNHQRVLVTTLTKRMAEDLTDYYARTGLKVRYLHSEISTLERIDIIDDLRRGEFNCLVGVNLLREGLDLPEVGLVGILDADKEGFLRSESSLIQTMGRAARNVEGQVMVYADKITDSVRNAVDITNKRRELQLKYNQKHNITPRSTERTLKEKTEKKDVIMRDDVDKMPKDELRLLIKDLKEEMKKAATRLDFEEGANIRDKILILEGVSD